MDLLVAHVGDHIEPLAEARLQLLGARVALELVLLVLVVARGIVLGGLGLARGLVERGVVGDVDEHVAVGRLLLVALGALLHHRLVLALFLGAGGQRQARLVGDLAEVEAVDDAVLGDDASLALVAVQAHAALGRREEEALGLQHLLHLRRQLHAAGSQLLGPRAHADDLDVGDGGDDLPHLGRIEHLALGRLDARRRGPLVLAVDRLQLGLDRARAHDLAGLLVDDVGVVQQRDDLVALDVQQVLFDPVGEVGRDVELQPRAVDPLLLGPSDVVVALLVGDLLADHDVDQDRARGILDGDALALLVALAVGAGGVEQPELAVLAGVVAVVDVLLHVDEGRRGLAHALGCVGGVVVVAGDDPASLLLLDGEAHDLGGLVVPGHDLERGRERGIGEAGEQRRVGVLERRAGDLVRPRAPRQAERAQRERDHDQGSAVHVTSLPPLLAALVRRSCGIASCSRRRLRT